MEQNCGLKLTLREGFRRTILRAAGTTMRFLCGPKLKGQTEMNNKHHIQAKTVKTIDQRGQRSSPCHRVEGYRRTPSVSPEQPGLSWFCGGACLVREKHPGLIPVTFKSIRLSKHARLFLLNSVIRSVYCVSSQRISFEIKCSSQ